MYLYSQLAKGNANRGSTFAENFSILLSQGIDHRADYPQGDLDYTTQPTSAEVAAAGPYRMSSSTFLFNGPSGANQTAVEASFADGHPVLLLIPLYDNFELADASHAFVDVPTAGMTNHGNHGVFAAKYDAAGVWIENQWGTSWGNKGWVELSWAFVNQFALEGWYMTADIGGLLAPSSVNATALSTSQIKVSWSGVSGATGYRVKRWNGATWPTIANNLSAAATSYTDVALAPNSKHYYYVCAFNGSGENCAPYVYATTWTGSGQPPNAPTNNGATALSSSSIRFAWTDNSNNETGFLIYRWSIPDGQQWVVVSTTGANANSFTDAGLQPNTRYLYDACAFNDGGQNCDQTSVGATTQGGATYHAITPTRILDTRDGTGGISGALPSHVAKTFQVTGTAVSAQLPGGIPANATAVTGNLTVTGQNYLGYLFIGPAAMNNPTSSTLNFPLGDDRANAVTVALSPSGALSVTYASPVPGTSAHAIFDVTGYFTPDNSGATYHALTPARILDSRDGTGGLSGAFVSHVARTFTVIGHGNVPANATAVTGNLTVTGQNNLGYLAMGPIAQDNPSSSTLNFPLGDDRANAVTVALGAGGTLSVTYAAPVAGKTAHVIFDVTGYFTPDLTGAKYVPLTPTRILDTRDGTGGISGALTSHAAQTFGVIGHGGVVSGATAVTGNLTVTGQNYLGYLFIGPAAMNNPTSSTLNFPLGDDRANAVTVALSPSGGLSVTYASPVPGTSAHAIFDVTGYFVGP
jgi:Fibronectin type III domain/Papain family cysteine protease